MVGKGLWGVLALLWLTTASAAAQGEAVRPDGGLDVTIRIDELVESHAAGATSLTFVIRDVSVGYEVSATGRGSLAGLRVDLPRGTVEQAFAPDKATRAFRLEKGRDGQPVLILRIGQDAGVKSARVPGLFARSDWNMLTAGRSITILADAEGMDLTRRLSVQLAMLVALDLAAEVRKQHPQAAFGAPELRTLRLDGDQAVAQGNRNGLSFSYPSAVGLFYVPVKANP
jgi:hypothetical protein